MDQKLLKISAGTQTGTRFKIRGKGIPLLNNNRRGDHVVTVVLQTPWRLSRLQKKMLAEFGHL